MDSYSECDPAKRESNLLITSIITDRIGRDEVLLPVNKNCDINLRKKLEIMYSFSLKKKKNS